MATRTIDFLPEIFQTPTNKQYLAATLDQLVQEPEFVKTQGYVGRKTGPGVRALDNYITEPTTERNNYQLEPGVISIDSSDSSKIVDAITYPGINDALSVEGAFTNNPDRLYKSQFYSWDPFVDFDKLVNYNEYYWTPAGPPVVPVYATEMPTFGTFKVVRKEGAYTIPGLVGDNPTVRLARGGHYQFLIDQQYSTVTEYLVGNVNNDGYYINYELNPSFTFTRGYTYVFNLNMNGMFPMYIKTKETLGTTYVYKQGVFNNGGTTGILRFTVPQDAPDTLYYVCSTERNMRGTINIVDADNTDGPRFCIQTQPGVEGVLDYAPNISSRNVLGVSSNCIDVGTVSFTVPYKTAQEYYYNMTDGGFIDLVSVDIPYSEVNNVPVTTFLVNHPNGIDEISNLDEMRIIFMDGSSPNVTIYKARYVDVGGVETIVLDEWATPPDLVKYFVNFGTRWSQTTWYKNVSWHLQPLLSAAMDMITYQDSLNPDAFGSIELVDVDTNFNVELDDILGQKDYTSPNGVVFTNGLLVKFTGPTNPSSYEDKTYVVEGVGTGIKLVSWPMVTPEVYALPGREVPIPYDGWNYDIGDYDGSFLESSDQPWNWPDKPDYITINRASPDRNPWSRSNRWVHKSVLEESYRALNKPLNLVQRYKAQRPIVEFRSGLKLFNFGSCASDPVAVIDYNPNGTHALKDVEGSLSYTVDGYTLMDGDLIIFPDDVDPNIRNNIYKYRLIDPDTIRYQDVDAIDKFPYDDVPYDGDLSDPFAQPIVHLEYVSTPSYGDVTVCMKGTFPSKGGRRGLSYWFNGITWVPAQQKTGVNDFPLFDVFDSSGTSFGEQSVYNGSDFTGTRLFGYETKETNTLDSVLGLPVSYYSVATVGDIVFQNYFYTDTFNYRSDNVGQLKKVSDGFIHEYSDCTAYTQQIGWQTAVTPTIVHQQFTFEYTGEAIKLDIPVSTETTIPPIHLYIADRLILPNDYQWQIDDKSTTIVLTPSGNDEGCCSKQLPYNIGDLVQIDVISDFISPTAFFQVPSNLENNPFNGNTRSLTMGTIRRHYSTICENLWNLEGEVNGVNNSRDLGNLVPYGTQIVQQSSPLTLTGYFLRHQQQNVFQALGFNSREYTKFKTKLMEYTLTHDVTNLTGSEILDRAITDILVGRTTNDPFYWSDMLPWGENYTLTTFPVNFLSGSTIDITNTYNFTESNYQGLLVYLTHTENNAVTTRLLLRNYDYTVSTDTPQITIITPLVDGDVVSVREYATTYGSYVPTTPSSMGLYPAFKPEVYIDETYLQPKAVIKGHDGSLTFAYGDVRDEVLLEFEQRVYNNIKCDGNPIPLTIEDVAPGFFRKTDYTRDEVTDIFSVDFLSWIGWNRVDYKSQQYIANNPWTYNYSAAGAKLNTEYKVDNVKETPLPGAWRGVYRYFYDTTDPSRRPWEMLGFSEMPDWWEGRYSSVPYTSTNLVLWEDLEAGYIAEPGNERYDARYARPGLTSVIPVDSEGELLNPMDSVVGLYNPLAFQKSWVVGDGGPAEYAWWTSSSYPYAVMRLLALTRPAEFFSLFADRDLYRFNTAFNQYLLNGRYRLDANGVQVYGNGVAKASYLNWIVDYNRQNGVDSSTMIETDLKNLDVRLCYRMAAFSDKLYSKIIINSSNATSSNRGQTLPDESYHMLFYKNQPFAQATYSSLVVEIKDAVKGHYTIYGYDMVHPYFTVYVSMSEGMTRPITAGGYSVDVPAQYSTQTARIPYGQTYTNITSVVDFILSYGKYLQSQGLSFVDVQNGSVMDWDQMASEFLYFAGQGWDNGTIMNLNPSGSVFTANRQDAVVDSLNTIIPENMILTQNRQPFQMRDLIIQRYGTEFSATSNTTNAISFVKARYVSYEHLVVLDNVSIFNDLIYDPVTASRQTRVYLTAYESSNWDGSPNAAGFIYNQNNVKQWAANTKYTKGEIVIYKNKYWQAVALTVPKANFEYGDWVPSNYTRVQQGLLANIPNKADELANSYDIHTGALDPDMNLLAFGLIGFRPRYYLDALNLDDVSQVNLYQQYIPVKGTAMASELFTNADIGRETSEYVVRENWAIMLSTYGGSADNRYIGIRLDEGLLNSNPSTVQIVDQFSGSQANQPVFYYNLWTQSFAVNQTKVFPTTTARGLLNALPSAGYVNGDDVDIEVFSIDNPTAIATNIDSVGVGTTIWAAKSNAYDWNVYRCEGIDPYIIDISDNLNSTAIVTFDGAHGLSVGDLFIIKFISPQVNGVYRAIGISGVDKVVISFSFTSAAQSSAAVTGLGLRLVSSRVKQPSDTVNLPLSKSIRYGAKVWVDDNAAGLWEMIEKVPNPFDATAVVSPPAQITTATKHGYSIAQNGGHALALIGAPAINSVFIYFDDDTVAGLFEANGQLPAPNPGLIGFGTAVSSGQYRFAAVGAPNSYGNRGGVVILKALETYDTYLPWQIIDGPASSGYFGTSTWMSWDENWLVVGSPGAYRADVYGAVPIEDEVVYYYGDGATTDFEFASDILIDTTKPYQLMVQVNQREVFYPAFTIVGTKVRLPVAPEADDIVTIARRTRIDLAMVVYYPTATGGAGSGARFAVETNYGTYGVGLLDGGVNYTVGNTLTILGTTVGGSSPANNITITVTAVNAGGTITAFTSVGGAATPTSFNLRNYLFTVGPIESFGVTVNKVLLRPGSQYTYNPATGVMTLTTAVPAGATIVVNAGTYWQHAVELRAPVYHSNELAEKSLFGFSATSTTDARQIFVGAPHDTSVGGDWIPNGNLSQPNGTVYVYDRKVYRHQVTDTAQTIYGFGNPYNPAVEPYDSTLYDTASIVNTPGSYDYTFVAYRALVQVFVNGVQLNDAMLNRKGSYIVLNNYQIQFVNGFVFHVGDNIEISTNQFELIDDAELPYAIDTAGFGYAIDMCTDNDELYVGAPWDGAKAVQNGSVTRFVNQTRIFGTTTSTFSNPVLRAGDTIRINDIEVAVPAEGTIESLVKAINEQPVPNVIAKATSDLTYRGDSRTKTFATGSVYDELRGFNTVVKVDNVLMTLNTDYTYANNAITFTVAPVAGSAIKIVSGRITISAVNKHGGYQPYGSGKSVLTVLPGFGAAFSEIGFETFLFAQSIYPPFDTTYGHFGASVSIDTSSVNLVVGADNSNAIEPNTFDNDTTTFDAGTMTFIDTVPHCGAAFTFDYLPSVNETATNPGMFVFGQQIWDKDLENNDKFGFAVNYVAGRLMVGAPNSSYNGFNQGSTRIFDNLTNKPSWEVKRLEVPQVDISKVVSVYTYDHIQTNYQNFYDFINPQQGKILGIAQQNIDYVGAVDPARYNVGPIHNVGASWGNEHVGKIWWDTENVRFVQPNQNDIIYSSRRWGGIANGSRVDVYQWIASPVPPQQYSGQGSVLSTVSYSVVTGYNNQGVMTTTYYYWVRDLTTIATLEGKTLSVYAIASYIADPRSSGVPYVALIDASTIGIYNQIGVVATDTIMHIEFTLSDNPPAVHEEFQLIQTESENSFVNNITFTKIKDSLAGIDYNGGRVPDALLSPGMQYGINFRPRQSMMVDRLLGLKNYLEYVNKVLIEVPIVEMKLFPTLFVKQPKPLAVETDGTVNWNKEVENLAVLSYQDLALVPVGYRFLVDSDSDYRGWWTIYEVKTDGVDKYTTLCRLQTYDVTRFWTYTDWYEPAYDQVKKIMTTVPNASDLPGVVIQVAPVGSTVKVANNNNNKWELYTRTIDGWKRVAVQDGTIQFNETLWNYQLARYGWDVEIYDCLYYDEDASIETRYIIEAINRELFINDMAIYRNRALVLLFEYIYSEFITPNWLSKTSLIDVQHLIRTLEAYPTYQPDNQNFVLDYINEVKPYHCAIRDFEIAYNGQDEALWMMTDFDNPAYWDETKTPAQYVSPVLLPYEYSASTIQNINSDVQANAQVWLERPWKYWYQNYTMGIYSVKVVNGGLDFTTKPKVVVVSKNGPVERDAVLDAVIDSTGKIIRIDVIDPGVGYTVTPEIQFQAFDGGGWAVAYPVLGTNIVPTYENTKDDVYHYLPRNMTVTVNFDRYQYTSNIEPWTANATYLYGTQVRFQNSVYSANVEPYVVDSSFDPDHWATVPSSTLSGVDRIKGFYVPGYNQPGLNLPLLIDGVDYPGVVVDGGVYSNNYLVDPNMTNVIPQTWNRSAGNSITWGSDLFDIDTVYTSSYRDIFLGTRPTDINVQGGSYVDPYTSHAPEELLPGQVFDTLDIWVIQEPGQGRLGQGWAAPTAAATVRYDASVISWAGLVEYPTAVVVTNTTTGQVLSEGSQYLVDWINYGVRIVAGANVGDVVNVEVYGLGGGFQMYRGDLTGATLTNPLIVPADFVNVQEIAMFVNGQHFTSFSYAAAPVNPLDPDPGDPLRTEITFGVVPGANDRVVFAVIGPSYNQFYQVNYSWMTYAPMEFPAQVGVTTYPLWNYTGWTNPSSFMVYVNGYRVRGPASTIAYGNDVNQLFEIPYNLGFSQGAILNSEVFVYVDGALATQGVDYVVNPQIGGSIRTVKFLTPPPSGQEIVVMTTAGAQATIVGTNLVFINGYSPPVGTIKVVTWNDTRQSAITTKVIVGPTSGTNNEFHLGRKIERPDRMIVSLNGQTKIYGIDFMIATDRDQTEIEFGYDINPTDVLQVTMFTDSVVTTPERWHIFQDMRGVQTTYRAPEETITTLSADVSFTEMDVIYVTDASALPTPVLVGGNWWGIVMIGAERVMYRELDLAGNAIRGLLRGTAGTARDVHIIGEEVISMSRQEVALDRYQNSTKTCMVVGDGVTTVYDTSVIGYPLMVNMLHPDAVQVFIDGERVTAGYTVSAINPVVVTFAVAPAVGKHIAILTENANKWSNPY